MYNSSGKIKIKNILLEVPFDKLYFTTNNYNFKSLSRICVPVTLQNMLSPLRKKYTKCLTNCNFIFNNCNGIL